MMLQVEPQRHFPLVWSVPDANDSATYYVKAYIYDGDSSRTLLDTVTLTDKSDKTFFARYRMPADPSGQGRPIIVIYKAYTDSGYTTEQTNYDNRFIQYFVVQHVYTPQEGLRLGGGNADVDYKKIAAMIKVAFEEFIKQIPQPEKLKLKPVDFTPVLDAIANKRIPEPIVPEKIDLSSLVTGQKNIMKAIDDKPVTPVTDLKPVMAELKKAKLDQVNKHLEGMFGRIKKFFNSDMEKNNKLFKQILSKLNSIPFLTLSPGGKAMPQASSSSSGEEAAKKRPSLLL